MASIWSQDGGLGDEFGIGVEEGGYRPREDEEDGGYDDTLAPPA